MGQRSGSELDLARILHVSPEYIGRAALGRWLRDAAPKLGERERAAREIRVCEGSRVNLGRRDQL
jgi:hypothetical protein